MEPDKRIFHFCEETMQAAIEYLMYVILMEQFDEDEPKAMTIINRVISDKAIYQRIRDIFPDSDHVLVKMAALLMENKMFAEEITKRHLTGE